MEELEEKHAEEYKEVPFSLNDHFYNFVQDWDSKFYFLVGGYGSSKSYHIATKLHSKLLEEKRIALVVRNTFESIRDSCYNLLQNVSDAMGLHGIIQYTKSPMEVKYPNGSKIIFKGLDDPEKLKSIDDVSIIWIEECSEIKVAAFNEIKGRLRNLKKSNHIILSTNPVSKSNWCYKYFFNDKENKVFKLDDQELYKKRIIRLGNVYYHHSTCDDNFFLPKDYIEQLDEMKLYDPDLYRIARKGQFGTNGLKVLPQLEEKPHYWMIQAMEHIKKRIDRVGMDFGFVTSKNAVVRLCIDDINKDLYIYWDYEKKGMTDDKTAIELKEFKESQELIRADSAEPKTIAYYQQQGFRMIGAKKGPGSRLQNTKKVKRFRHIYVSDRCQATLEELKDLVFAVDKDGEIIEDEFNIDPHTFSAIWYALDGYEVADIKEEIHHKTIGKGIDKDSYSNIKNDPRYGRSKF